MARIELPDNQGNKIISDLPNLYLLIKGERKPRQIGIIQNRVMFVTRNRKKHLHNISQSYGFNLHVVANAKLFDHVQLTDQSGIYLIPNSVILTGKVMRLGRKEESEFERQIFLPLSTIETYKINSLF